MQLRAGLADWSCLAKFDLKGSHLTAAPTLAGPSRCWHLGGAHYLITCDPAEREIIQEELRGIETANASGPSTIYCTDVTSVMADLLIAGPDGRGILGKLTSANLSDSALPDGGCVQSGVAHVRSIILRWDIGNLPAFHLLVGREYSEGVWDALLHAGHEFSLAPFGLQTYQALQSGAAV